MAAVGGEVRTERHGRVLVVTIDHPPANALTPDLRKAIVQALHEAQSAQAVVICGAGRNFSAATSVDVASGAPTMADLCRAIEDLNRPVVVALQGSVMGAGAELALAAHARVADAEARIVFPEVGLGLTPEAGTTQRLPRLVGATEALEMLLKARPVSAVEGLAMGLVDQVVEGNAVTAAVAYAAAMDGPRPVSERTDGLRDVAGFQAVIATAREDMRRGVLPAPARIIDCVEAALVLPFENGLALEAVAREDLEASAEAQGLQSAALAERLAAALPAAVAQTTPKAVAHLGLNGEVPQTAALALLALSRGIKVTWVEADRERLATGLKWVASRQEAELRAGRLSAVQRDADWARLQPSSDLRDLIKTDMVVHAAAGPAVAMLQRQAPTVPQLVLGGVEGGIGLALSPSARASELALPDPVVPVQVAAAVQFLRRVSLPPLLVGKMPVLGRRVSAAGRATLARLLAMGVPRRVVAAALDGFGFPMPEIPDPADAAAMRPMDEEEILRRWQGAMANEAFRLLAARVARRPSDVDHILVAGHGFPRWRGGPMHHAATRGLMVLRRDLRAWASDDEALWKPAPLLDRLISEGRLLSELDSVPA